MPTSDPGNSESTGCAGFTLLELLIVILVMALGFALVAAGLSSGRSPAQVEALRLAAVLEYAGMRARTTGQALAWQSRGDGYFFRRFDERWREIGAEEDAEDGGLLRPRHLPAGVSLQRVVSPAESLELSQDADHPPALLLPPAGLAPRFVLRLVSAGAIHEVQGDVAGRVAAVTPPVQ